MIMPTAAPAAVDLDSLFLGRDFRSPRADLNGKVVLVLDEGLE